MTDGPDGFRRETLVAIDAVEQAVQLARDRAGSRAVHAKGHLDIVTDTDVAVEDAVRGILLDALGIPVVGEERADAAPSDGAPYWFVDPICGTRNFASGIPLYSVNLGLVEDGEMAVAVVGDPSGEISVAERGRRAWARADGAWRTLEASADSRVVCIEDSHSEGDRREQAARFTADLIRAHRWEIRSLSSTLSLPYLAAGRIAAYLLFWTEALHSGAGALLAAEAGAIVTDLDGRPWAIHSDSMLAAGDDDLHTELLGMCRRAAAR
jgi:myo-inositol-1(or 4)-monophosphatase